MKYETSGYYIVQFLIAVAVYYYFRNGLRNLKNVYPPNNKWLSMLYHLIAFKFRALVGDDLADIVDKEERRKNTRKEVKNSIKKVSDVIDESKELVDPCYGWYRCRRSKPFIIVAGDPVSSHYSVKVNLQTPSISSLRVPLTLSH